MTKKQVGLGILLGVAIGAGVAVLMSKKGSKLRGKIKDNVDDAKKELGGKYEALKKRSHKHAEETYKDLVSNLTDKSEDVVSFLETKLAALKKEVAKY